MSENKKKIDLSNIPNVPPQLRDLLDSELAKSGRGTWQVDAPADSGMIVVFHGIGFSEMEAMGEEERERLGLDEIYQTYLEHRAADNPDVPTPPA